MSLLSPQDALTYATVYLKNSRLADVEVRVLDDVVKYMWMAAPWRWTIGSFPAVTLAANQQDYAVTVPSDFLYLIDSYVSDGNQTAPRPLRIEPTLPTTTKYVGQPGSVAVIGSTVRVSPVPGAIQPGTTPQLISLYKKVAPDVTAGNIGTVGIQGFPDSWFWVFQEGVLWRAYLYGDDDRAGNVTFADGKIQYTGQRASFEAGLQYMREEETLPAPRKENNG